MTIAFDALRSSRTGDEIATALEVLRDFLRAEPKSDLEEFESVLDLLLKVKTRSSKRQEGVVYIHDGSEMPCPPTAFVTYTTKSKPFLWHHPIVASRLTWLEYTPFKRHPNVNRVFRWKYYT